MDRPLCPHDTITEGDAIGVLLFNHPQRVWLYREDYDRIVREHGQRAWTWYATGRVARLVLPGGKMPSVARLVLENDGSGFVHYRDDDRLNLRRDRLSIGELKPLRAGWKRRDRRSAPPARGGANGTCEAAASRGAASCADGAANGCPSGRYGAP